MSVDPRRPIVQVMARLGRETQLHLDERHHRFNITDKVILIISLLLVILACVNVYYVTVLSRDLDGIVSNMGSMYRTLERVETDMDLTAKRVQLFDQHTQRMSPIAINMHGISEIIPSLRGNMAAIQGEMSGIEQNMHQVTGAMAGISRQMHHITGGVSVMRRNVHSISGPMGAINPILPN